MIITVAIRLKVQFGCCDLSSLSSFCLAQRSPRVTLFETLSWHRSRYPSPSKTASDVMPPACTLQPIWLSLHREEKSERVKLVASKRKNERKERTNERMNERGRSGTLYQTCCQQEWRGGRPLLSLQFVCFSPPPPGPYALLASPFF